MNRTGVVFLTRSAQSRSAARPEPRLRGKSASASENRGISPGLPLDEQGAPFDNSRVLLADLVAASQAVSAVRARGAKLGELAALLRRLAPDEAKAASARKIPSTSRASPRPASRAARPEASSIRPGAPSRCVKINVPLPET
jgi:hypothetical protein